MTGDEIVQLCRRHTIYEWSAQAKVDPIPVARAAGVYFWTPEGKRFLDFNSQLMCTNVGHSHPTVVRAIQEQAATLAYANPFMATEPRARLGAKLAAITPGDIDTFFFTNGGADANENAIRIARVVSGRHKVLARYRSYHGGTAGAIALTGDARRWASEPGMPGVVRAPDFHRWGRRDPEPVETCLRELEDVIRFEGGQTIAAFVMEPVVGTNGILIPPDGYMRGVREICDRHGILLISDEVMSGWGRTGKWFAVDHWDVVPDMITTAKGITSGYVPLGAVIVSDKIADYFEDRMLWCGLTYSGHPLACAAGVATLQVYEEDRLIENAAAVGRHLGQRLEDIKTRHASVGDVRYIGLFSALEIVKDRTTKEPIDPLTETNRYLRANGLFTFIFHNVLFVVPPLCITEVQLDEGLAIVEKALEITDAIAQG